MYHLQLLLWLFLTMVMAQVDDEPYCSNRYERLCQGKGMHVGCQFPYRGQGEACENYTAIIFSNELKRFILHYINRRRQKIASGHERVRGGARLPKPEVMMLVQWDRELAFLAQRLADQCRFVHDDCRATVRYPYAGQTVGEVRWRRTGESIEIGARRSIGRVLDAWWGERRRVLVKQLTTPFTLISRGAVWGHFSQLAVWTLRAMGCGAVHHGYSKPRLLLVCDFSHTNMLGQRTITPGSLTPCPSHTLRIQESLYPLLCAPLQRPPDFHGTLQRSDQYYTEENEYEDPEEETVAPKMKHVRPFTPAVPEDTDTEEETSRNNVPLTREQIRVVEKIERPRYQDQRIQKGILREKLNRELSLRNQDTINKGVHKIGISRNDDVIKDEYTPHIEERRKEGYTWRSNFRIEERKDDNEEEYHKVIPLKKQFYKEVIESHDEPTKEINRPTQQQFMRQRWKHPRNRPRRPGANALITMRQGRRQLKTSLLMDQEVAEQLYRDTGFKMSERKPSR